jgi:hypothetical protein
MQLPFIMTYTVLGWKTDIFYNIRIFPRPVYAPPTFSYAANFVEILNW